MAEDKKKKKEPGVIERGKQIYGLGKQLYKKYMAGRKRMAETRPPTGPQMRKVEPPAPEPKEPQATQPPKKKKKPRGGVGGVMDAVQERKRRMQEALEASD